MAELKSITQQLKSENGFEMLHLNNQERYINGLVAINENIIDMKETFLDIFHDGMQRLSDDLTLIGNSLAEITEEDRKSTRSGLKSINENIITSGNDIFGILQDQNKLLKKALNSVNENVIMLGDDLYAAITKDGQFNPDTQQTTFIGRFFDTMNENLVSIYNEISTLNKNISNWITSDNLYDRRQQREDKLGDQLEQEERTESSRTQNEKIKDPSNDGSSSNFWERIKAALFGGFAALNFRNLTGKIVGALGIATILRGLGLGALIGSVGIISLLTVALIAGAVFRIDKIIEKAKQENPDNLIKAAAQIIKDITQKLWDASKYMIKITLTALGAYDPIKDKNKNLIIAATEGLFELSKELAKKAFLAATDLIGMSIDLIVGMNFFKDKSLIPDKKIKELQKSIEQETVNYTEQTKKLIEDRKKLSEDLNYYEKRLFEAKKKGDERLIKFAQQMIEETQKNIENNDKRQIVLRDLQTETNDTWWNLYFGTWERIKNTFSDWKDSWEEKFNKWSKSIAAWNKEFDVLNLIGTSKEEITDGFSDFISNIKNSIISFFDDIEKWASDKIDSVKKFFGFDGEEERSKMFVPPASKKNYDDIRENEFKEFSEKYKGRPESLYPNFNQYWEKRLKELKEQEKELFMPSYFMSPRLEKFEELFKNVKSMEMEKIGETAGANIVIAPQSNSVVNNNSNSTVQMRVGSRPAHDGGFTNRGGPDWFIKGHSFQ